MVKMLATVAALTGAFFFASCDVVSLDDESVVVNQAVDRYRINTALGAVGRIQTGMTENDLARLEYPSERSDVVLEGDTYTSIRLEIGGGKYVECLVSSGIVDSISIRVYGILDENEIGVGSTLGRLREAYPDGKLLVGDADGRYANFVNGTKVVFQMDQGDLEPACFEYGSDSCEVRPRTKVIGMVVNSGPARW